MSSDNPVDTANTSTANITANANSLNPVLNPLSPLSLHHNDNPGVAIVLDPLVGSSNFISWSQAVRRGLSVKNKLKLIDGSLKIPSEEEDSVIHAAWVRANDLVLMWIVNSISPDIKKTLQYFSTTKQYFEDYVHGYFYMHARYILVSCKAYMEGVQVGCLGKGGVQLLHDDKCSQQFKNQLADFITTLENTFSGIGAKDCEGFLSSANKKENVPPTAATPASSSGIAYLNGHALALDG